MLLGEVAAGAACLCSIAALGVDLRASCSVALSSGDGFRLIGWRPLGVLRALGGSLADVLISLAGSVLARASVGVTDLV